MEDEKPLRLKAPAQLWARERERIRNMRDAPTRAEAALWARLRRSALGAKFRQQHAIGPYVVDFYCVTTRLVVEVAGPVDEFTLEYDAERTAYLESLGLKVVRFTNDQIQDALDNVVTSIRPLLTESD